MTVRITKIETYKLADRQDPGSYGFFVKVSASDGTFGFGEADTLPVAAEAVIKGPCYHDSMGGLAQILIGHELTHPEDLWDRMNDGTLSFGRDGVGRHAMAAIDIALWDLYGKQQNRPVSALLGDPLRDTVRCYAVYGLSDDLAQSVDIARRIVAAGFSAAKFGWPPFGIDLEEDDRIAGALRAAIGPGVDLLLDAGMAWDVTQALERCERLARHSLHWLEEPLRPYDIDGYATLNAVTAIPIAAGEMAASETELKRLIAVRGVDILQIDLARVGLTVARRLAVAAAEAGIRVVNHTYTHIANAAASIHLMAVAPQIGRYECQFARNTLRDALAQGQLTPVNGRLPVPTAPGLGVSVDERILQKFAVD